MKDAMSVVRSVVRKDAMMDHKDPRARARARKAKVVAPKAGNGGNAAEAVV